MTILRIDNGTVVEVRTDADLSAIPPHKRSRWRVVTGDPPAHNAAVQQLTSLSYEITDNAAVRSWQVTSRSREEQVAAVKTEAQRRIIVRTGATTLEQCMVRQLNALMRATELTDKRARGENLTAPEQAEETVLRALADDIKAIRSASNTIEQLDPVPADYAANARWP